MGMFGSFYALNFYFLHTRRKTDEKPYSKPTQVDSLSKRRCLREFILRNSANLSRIFGRRDASAKRGQVKKGGEDCLAKTQGIAKSKDAV